MDADLWTPPHPPTISLVCYALGQQLLSLKLNEQSPNVRFSCFFCRVFVWLKKQWLVCGLNGRFSLPSQSCHLTSKFGPLSCFDSCHRKILIPDLFKETLFYTDIIQIAVACCQAETAPSRDFLLIFFFPLKQNFLPHKRMVSIVLFLSGSKSPVSEAMASVSSELAAAKQLPSGAKSYYLWMLLLLPLIVHSHEASIKVETGSAGGWGWGCH